jgi:hypothetical protein
MHRAGAFALDAFLLVALAFLFDIFRGDPRYAPDYYVQVDYLWSMRSASVNFVESIANNTVFLDYVVLPLYREGGFEIESTLKWLYWAVFIVKYVALLRWCNSRLWVVSIFLWGFYALDVNQIRLNIALLIFMYGCLRTGVIASGAMVMAHLSAALCVPMAATEWLGRLSKRRLVLVGVFFAAVVVYVSLNASILDERFLLYLNRDEWVPKVLVACPVMLFVVRREFNGLPRMVLAIMALLPIAVALLGLSIVAARFAEMIYMAFLIKLGVRKQQTSRSGMVALLMPAVLLFAFRTVLGIKS